jgi:hypothetical protein
MGCVMARLACSSAKKSPTFKDRIDRRTVFRHFTKHSLVATGVLLEAAAKTRHMKNSLNSVSTVLKVVEHSPAFTNETLPQASRIAAGH